MIAAWMLFTLGIGALLFIAAWLAERALASSGRPVRGVWAAAMIGTTVFALLSLSIAQKQTTTAPASAGTDTSALPGHEPALTPNSQGSLVTEARTDSLGSSALSAMQSPTSPSIMSRLRNQGDGLLSSWTFPVTESSPLRKLDVPLIALWLFSSIIGALLCAISVWRMSRERMRWRGELLDGAPILVSHDTGPALVGILHYSIVVPGWALTLDDSARRLLLAHEREHARRFDPVLMATAVMLVVVAPWNVFNWFFFKRLHLAIELDCDQRVLRKYPDAHNYGALLLDVAERVLPSAIPAAAFVEHGSSLDTRIGALMQRTIRASAARAATSTVGVAALLIVACVAPRPYSSLPPAQRASRLASDLRDVLRSDSLTSAIPATQRASIAQSINDAAVRNPEVRTTPAAFSAVAAALDKAEAERLRNVAIGRAPEAFANWSRKDSALMLLFNSDGQVVKRAAYPTNRLQMYFDATQAFTSVFAPPEIFRLRYAGEMTIAEGAHGERLDTPLRVLFGRMQPGAAVPVTREDRIPSHERMVELLRSTHPEVLNDNADHPLVGVLLFGARANLLGSAAVKMEDSYYSPDGQATSDFDAVALKKAFGAQMENNMIFQSGRVSYFDDRTPKDGKPRLLYAWVMPKSEFGTLIAQTSVASEHASMGTSASSSRGGPPVDLVLMQQRLLALVQERVPEAFGVWSRVDSAVVLLFDSNMQLIGRATNKIIDHEGVDYVADLVSKRTKQISANDIEAVGHVFLPASATGRELDIPLQVIWARVRPGATILPAKP